MSNLKRGQTKVIYVPAMEFMPGDILTWAEVSSIHRVRRGIYYRNGCLISLLTDFGQINHCYPDYRGKNDDEIFYTGSGRRGDQRLDAANLALMAAITTGHAVPLFNKLAPGKWRFEGHWTVNAAGYIRDEAAGRMVWKFRLVRYYGS